MPERICFIDDDDKLELPLFDEVFGNEFDIISATTLEECVGKMRQRANWTPQLFVLDLYFPLTNTANDAELAALRSHPLELPNDQAEMREAYRNYLRAEDRLDSVLHAWRQGPQGGIELGRKVHEQFPRTPIVFYSRKARAEDVLNCMTVEGVLNVLRKPSGASDDDIKAATERERPLLTQRFRQAIAEAASSSEFQRAVKKLKEIDFFKKPLFMFYSYSSHDENYRVELERRLKGSRLKGLVTAWHFRQIEAGTEWEDDVDAHLDVARLILLLLSPAYLSSPWCKQEMEHALRRQREEDDVVVVPIVIHPVDLSSTPLALSYLQALPKGGKPISTWWSQSRAWDNVMDGLRSVIVRRNLGA